MMPRLGEKYDIKIETMSKPPAEYNTDAYFELDLPVAPAIMIGEDILVEGSDIPEETLETAICERLGLAPPDPKKKGLLNRMLKR
jgi:hypothetical protein